MNSRERVLRAIQFQKPDRPPISHAILPSAQYHYGDALKQITDAVPEDFAWGMLPDLPVEKLPPMYKEGINRDEFGTVWHVTDQGRCGIPVGFPIAENWENYKDYRWPVFGAGVPKFRLYSGHMNGTGDGYYARGGWIVFFEQMQQLHGFEATLMDIAQDRPEIYRLRDDLLQFNLDWLDRWLAQEYQGLHFADDCGRGGLRIIHVNAGGLFDLVARLLRIHICGIASGRRHRGGNIQDATDRRADGAKEIAQTARRQPNNEQ